MIIKILGGGCDKCKALYQNVEQALAENEISAQIEKVEDMVEIINYGVMRTPALVIDNDVKISGRVATVEEIKKILA